MKKSVLLVVTLLCMASLMAAMAYSRANVTNGANFSIRKTNDSLLALEANSFHAASSYKKIGWNGDVLNIDWTKGHNGKGFGIQFDSVYEWDSLFCVKNNSEHDVEVTIRIPSGTRLQGGSKKEDWIKTAIKMKTSEDANWHTLAYRYAKDDEVVKFQLASGAEKWIDAQLDTTLVSEGHFEAVDFSVELVVDAEVIKTVQ